MFNVELQKYTKIDLFFMPLGLKVSRRNCVNMRKKQVPRALTISIPLSASTQAEPPTAESDVPARQGEIVASTGPIHTKLLRYIARVALPTLRTSSDRLQSPRN